MILSSRIINTDRTNERYKRRKSLNECRKLDCKFVRGVKPKVTTKDTKLLCSNSNRVNMYLVNRGS